jgi:hypothetical protein
MAAISNQVSFAGTAGCWDARRRFLEFYNNGRTTDYPFGYLQVRLSANAVGTGQIMAAARIRFDKKKGEYQIESFGNRYLKATSIYTRK